MKLLIPALFAVASLLPADTLILRDGRAIRGTFVSGNSQTVRFLPDGGRTQNYSISRVDRVEFGSSTAAATNSSDTRYSDRDSRYPDRAEQRADRSYERSSTRSRAASEYVVPAGTVLTVRTIDRIESDDAKPGQGFRASLDEDLVVDGRLIARKGADATISVVEVDEARKIEGREKMTLALTEIVTSSGRRLHPDTSAAQIASESGKSDNVKVIGGTAALGAIIGAIAGGGKGAAIGAASGAGAGAAVQAMRGQKIEVPSETRLQFTLDRPMSY